VAGEIPRAQLLPAGFGHPPAGHIRRRAHVNVWDLLTYRPYSPVKAHLDMGQARDERAVEVDSLGQNAAMPTSA
jgi:hypothetical protein